MMVSANGTVGSERGGQEDPQVDTAKARGEALRADLNKLLAEIYEIRRLSPYPLPEQLRGLVERVVVLARQGPKPLIEVCFDSVFEVLTHLLLRLRIACYYELVSVTLQAGPGPIHAAPGQLNQLLLVTEDLAHMLTRLTACYGKYNHVAAIAERESRHRADPTGAAAGVGTRPGKNGRGPVHARTAGLDPSQGHTGGNGRIRDAVP